MGSFAFTSNDLLLEIICVDLFLSVILLAYDSFIVVRFNLLAVLMPPAQLFLLAIMFALLGEHFQYILNLNGQLNIHYQN